MRRREPAPGAARSELNDELRAVVHDVIRLTPNIVEVVVHAPMAARAFQPGQFYRLQNYETLAPRTTDTVLAMEGLGADRRVGGSREGTALDHRARNGRIVGSVRAAEAGRAGDPDGTDRHADRNARAGNGAAGRRRTRQRGAVLHRPEAARSGSRVIYFAGYKKIIDRYKVEEIEKAADVVVWCCDEAPGFTPGRVQDNAFVGNIVEAMAAYGRGDLGDDRQFRCSSVDRLIVIGSDGMMRAVQQARHTVLRAVSEAGSQGHRQHQLADAVHDEGDLRAVPASAQGSDDRRRDGGVLLLQSGSAARSRRFRQPAHAPLAERRAGEADQAVDRPLPARDRRAAGIGNAVTSSR